MNKQSNIQDKIEECKKQIYERVMESLTTWHNRELGNKIVYDDECVGLALKDAITLIWKEAQEIMNKREKEIIEIIDKIKIQPRNALNRLNKIDSQCKSWTKELLEERRLLKKEKESNERIMLILNVLEERIQALKQNECGDEK